MKKIINNRLYDTDTARLLGEWDNGLGLRDFDFLQEALYRKRTGEHFLYGHGGARTKYSEHAHGLWTDGEAITPLTYEEAVSWAEEHLSADEYIAVFGPVSEGEEDPSVPLNLYLPASLVAQLRREASQADLSVSAYVVQRLTSPEA